MPIELERSNLVGTWHVVPGRLIETGKYIDLLAEEAFQPTASYCALFKTWDHDGFGSLSIMDLEFGTLPREERVYERKRYIHNSRYAVMNQRVNADRRASRNQPR